MRARVYKSTGSWYQVKNDAGKRYNARLKGVFKTEDISSTNPIAVGDDVEIKEELETEQSAVITDIHDRRNYVIRSSPHTRWQHHIIASNLDQSLLFITLKEPRTSQGFVDRFLISCEAYHIPAILIVNKADIYRKKELALFDEWHEMYTAIGYTVLLTSVLEGKGMDDVRGLLQHKTTLLSGHSGVGKSSFINAVFPEMGLRTQEVSGWSGKGMHTTTFAEMFDIPGGGSIIDTPGIRELGLVDISKQELSHYFPEMRQYINECQFNNCSHINEPGCAVKDAVAEGYIHENRYISYLTLYDSIEGKQY